MPSPIAHIDSLAAHPRTATSSKIGTGKNPADTIGTEIPAAHTVDWSTALPYPVYDAVNPQWEPFIIKPATYKETSGKEVFGALSTTAPPAMPPQTEVPSLTTNTAFQGFVLLLAATFAMLLYHNLGNARQLLTRISHDTATGQHLYENPGGSGFSRFLNITTTLGMLFVGVMAVKYADQFVTPAIFKTLPHAAVLGLSLLVALICAAVVFYQWLILRLAGAITLSRTLISQIFLLKRTFFSLTVIVASPILLLYALCPRGTGRVWFFVVVIQLAITVVLYLKESLNLFICKKISTLHWFLYLCVVEIFPVSLLWLLTTRSCN